MIKAFIFDMDGVLADTEDLSLTILTEYFASIGVKVSKKDVAPYLGAGERTYFDGPARDLKAEKYSYEEASAFFRPRYEELSARTDVRLGSLGLIRQARKAGLLLALASSAPKWKVYANIRAIGLSPSDFDFVASGRDIKRNKPEKDIYELCLIKLGTGAEEAVVFEDSTNGIIAAKKAGCRVVALTTTESMTDVCKAGADAVVSDLDAVGPFSTPEEAEALLFDKEEKSGKVVYGAVEITPRSHSLPFETLLEKAKEQAKKAWENAYTPFSKYHVGAAVVSAATGRIYPGCNIENSSLGATICAERNAITTAIASEGEVGLDLVVVYSDDDPPAPPCALCLQVIAEFARPDTPVVLFARNGHEVRYCLRDLLPNPFIFPSLRK